MGDDRLKKLQSVHRQILHCKRCHLSKKRLHAVPGEGPLNAKVFLIGQAPGRKEDQTGRPFVGRAGVFLNKLFTKYNIKREEVFITSTIKCFPPENRTPSQEEIETCRVFTITQLGLINPQIVVLLGGVAQRSFHAEPFFQGKKIIKTVHPASSMRFPKMRKKIEDEFLRLKKVI